MTLPYRFIHHRFSFVVLTSLLLLLCLMGRWQSLSQARSNAGMGKNAPVSSKAASEEDAVAKLKKNESFGKLPLYFVENQGQVDKRIAYYIQGRDKTIYFTDSGITFALHSGEAPEMNAPQAAGNPQRYIVKLDFIGARAGIRPEGRQATEAIFSYFTGPKENWKTGLKSYSELVYRNLWPGIDLVYAGTVNRMKYTFHVRPGADPKQIKLAYRGAAGVQLNPAGELEINTPLGGFKDEQPISHQTLNHKTREVKTDYVLQGETALNQKGETQQVFGFKLDDYDPTQELVIDPAVLVYCGYIGGSGGSGDSEQAEDIAVDGSGNAYVTGWTDSSQGSFPVTAGPDLTYSAATDAYVAKVNAAGTALLYCGYLGGAGTDRGNGIAVDSTGNAYITGWTGSGANSGTTALPLTVGPDLTYNGSFDAFVAKLNPTGTAVLYCGFIGGSGTDNGYDIAIDSAGNAYITGNTFSTQTTFPDGDPDNNDLFPVPGLDQTHNGSDDAFVAKVSASGASLVYASFLGGVNSDIGWGIALDSSNNAIIGGQTTSDQTTFPTGTGFGVLTTFDGVFNGVTDAFLAKFDAAGTALSYAGYVGGSGTDIGYDVAVNSAGAAYFTGYTFSSQTTFPDGDPDNNDLFPVTGIDQTYNNGDAFLVTVSSAGALSYATYIGGNNFDLGYGVAVDSSNNVYLSGYTGSVADFPKDGGFTGIPGFDQTQNGNNDAFVVRLNSAGTAYDFATFLGGARSDIAYDIALDSSNNVYVVGMTRSDESTFPVMNGPDLTFNSATGFDSGADSFIAKFNATGTALSYCGYIGGKGEGNDRGQSIAVDNTGNAYVAGWTTSVPPEFPVNTGPDLTPNGGFDAFVAKVNPAGTALLFLGYLGGASTDQALGLALDSSNNIYLCGSTFSDQTTFPVTVGPDLVWNNSTDAFVAKINAAGTSLDYCGYIGGTSTDVANDVAVDSGGNAYVTGYTFSTQTTFPDGDGFGAVTGADVTHNGNEDAFIVKVPAVPSAGVAYASYIGGNGTNAERGNGVEVDSSGNAYVVGITGSTEATFPDGDGFPPITGIDVTLNGGQDGFIAKLNNVGTAFTYVSYIGGSSTDTAAGVDVDGSNNVYVAGHTFSTETTFPTGTGFGALTGYDTTYNGGQDAFVLKLNAAGSAYVYGTFVGGSSTETATGIALDGSNNAYVTGQTFSTNFPALDLPDMTYNGTGDAFVFKLNSVGTGLLNSGYLGGDLADFATGIAVDSAGSAYLVGYTNSTETTFPVLAGPDLTFTPNSTGTEAFVAKIAMPSSCSYTLSSTSVAPEGAGGNFAINVTTGAGCNWAAVSLSTFVTITSGATGTGNGSVGFTVNANPGSFSRSTQLLIAGQLVTIQQAGGIGCAVTPEQVFVRHGAGAGAGSFNVIAGPNCKWAATAFVTPPAVSWVTITSATVGTGSGTISYTFTANPDPTRRFQTIIVGGRGITIIQEGTTPAANIIVNSTADTIAIDGACTLREAILNANTNSQLGSTDCAAGTGRDRITFNIAGVGPHTIMPTSALPDVTDPAEIDGATQPGASCTTPGGLKIELNGTNAGATPGLFVTGGFTLIRGLVINRFAQDGIRLSVLGGNVVSCNYVGTDVTGNADLGNGVQGIQVQSNASTNIIGGLMAGDGNLVSGNTNEGVNLVGAGSNQVIGNRIGTNAAGTAAIPNGGSGVFMNSTNSNIIGGTSVAARNLISGNGANGVRIFFSSSNLVMGNYIGTDVTGTLDLGNTLHGVEINGGSPFSNILGGLSPGFRNIISGNNTNGVVLGGDTTAGNITFFNLVLGNYIGTNAAGTGAIGNTQDGVAIWTNTQNNHVGAVAEPSGFPAITGGGNRIAFNGRDGVAILQTGAQLIIGNRVEGNQIYSNGALGIDLSDTAAPDGVTANDVLDVDGGANTLQNFPIILGASSTGSVVNVTGKLNSTPFDSFRIHVYANAACDGSMNGEGEIYLGETFSFTDASGDDYFSGSFNVAIPSNYVITATATSFSANSVSEFSACFALTCPVTIAPTYRNFTSAAGMGTINVTAAGACSWNAVSALPSWLMVTGGASGMGNGVVSYSLTANGTPGPRFGAISVNGVGYLVFQADAAHSLTLTPASYAGTTNTARDAVVATQGTGFSINPPVSATTNPLPAALSDISYFEVQDNAGVTHPGEIYFVTGSNLNFKMPTATANGLATVFFNNNQGFSFVGTIQVDNVAPTLFSADNTGAGVLRGWIERTVGSVTTIEPVARFDQATMRWVAVPVALGAPAETVRLVVLGTGFRYRSSLPAVTATINGAPVLVTAAQAHPPTLGFDELRITLPSAGGLPSGLHNLAVSVDGNPANVVKLEIQ